MSTTTELHVGQRRRWKSRRTNNRPFRIVAILPELDEIRYCYDGEEPSRGWPGWNVDIPWTLAHSVVVK